MRKERILRASFRVLATEDEGHLQGSLHLGRGKKDTRKGPPIPIAPPLSLHAFGSSSNNLYGGLKACHDKERGVGADTPHTPFLVMKDYLAFVLALRRFAAAAFFLRLTLGFS